MSEIWGPGQELQADILLQKEDHTNADKEFHITASTVLNLAKRATEIIKSSEPEEKRQFLGYLLQNCQLNGRNLDFTLRNPFNLIAKYSSYPTMQRPNENEEVLRTVVRMWANREHWKTLFQDIYGYFIKNPLDFEFNMAFSN